MTDSPKFVMVPVVPTDEMLDAACEHDSWAPSELWPIMVAAAPASPVMAVGGERRAVLEAAKVIWAKADFHSNGDHSPNTWENVSQPVRDWALDVANAVLEALSASPSLSQEREGYQDRVNKWMTACFGAEISADKVERNHRFLEEALELVQSIGCTQSEAHQLVDYVYGRDQGEVNQEVGGVMVTLAALCLANGLDMTAAGETELARIWTKVDKIRAKQAAKPKHSPLPALSQERDTVTEAGKDGVAMCEDCERPYGHEHGFPDLIIPYWAWKEISPSGNDGGLLCPSCICKRLHDKNIRCEGAFMSGPIISVDQPTMHTARRVENIELAIEGRNNSWSGIREMLAAIPDASERTEGVFNDAKERAERMMPGVFKP